MVLKWEKYRMQNSLSNLADSQIDYEIATKVGLIRESINSITNSFKFYPTFLLIGSVAMCSKNTSRISVRFIYVRISTYDTQNACFHL